MAGRLNGVAALIKAQYPKALYFHCASHALNLCIVSTSKVTNVMSMWVVLKDVSFFFSSSPKRQGQLEDAIKEAPADLLGNSPKVKLVDFCRTRWVARHNALVAFKQLFLAVVATLELVGTNSGGSWNSESVASASSLLRSITDFRFIVTFTVVSDALGYIHALTIRLQNPGFDICQAYREVEMVHKVISKARTSVDVRHSDWWKAAVAMAEQVTLRFLVSSSVSEVHQKEYYPYWYIRTCIEI